MTQQRLQSAGHSEGEVTCIGDGKGPLHTVSPQHISHVHALGQHILRCNLHKGTNNTNNTASTNIDDTNSANTNNDDDDKDDGNNDGNKDDDTFCSW